MCLRIECAARGQTPLVTREIPAHDLRTREEEVGAPEHVSAPRRALNLILLGLIALAVGLAVGAGIGYLDALFWPWAVIAEVAIVLALFVRRRLQKRQQRWIEAAHERG